MKKITFTLTALALGFATMSFVNNNSNQDEIINISEKASLPTEVKEIIDNKCYGCHNSESKNKKGKKKLSFDTFDQLSVYKQIGKYEGIHEAITEGEMPPEKFLKKYPNKTLTDSEKKTLISWAKSEGDKLSK